MYAIIEACGKQYKVAEGDVVFFEKLDAEEIVPYLLTGRYDRTAFMETGRI